MMFNWYISYENDNDMKFIFSNTRKILNLIVKHYLLIFNLNINFVKLLLKIIYCLNYLPGTRNCMFYYYYYGNIRLYSY